MESVLDAVLAAVSPKTAAVITAGSVLLSLCIPGLMRLAKRTRWDGDNALLRALDKYLRLVLRRKK